jgi:preprotein translocase subunit SecY
MLERFLNIFRIPDLRKRIGFTLGLLAVYRLGAHIPTPGIDAAKLAEFFNSNAGSTLGLFDLFNGGNLRRLTIFALGIMPYITASIIFQLLTVIYEPLAKLQKEGELGRRKITQWTRYVTVLLAIVQSLFIALSLTGQSAQGMTTIPRASFLPLCVITLTAGTAFIMWLGEQITERGIGNGMSLLIFTGIVVGLPRGIADLYDKVHTGQWGALTPVAVALLIIMMVVVVAFIVYVERSERRIPIQSAKRMVGRRMTQASNSFLPLKVNSGGVMPVIFAASILSAPLLLQNVSFFGSGKLIDNRYLSPVFRAIAPAEPMYAVLYMVAIVFFAYFYISIIFRPDDIADNMRKYGSFIPGIRPGKRTSDFINDVLTRITLVGAIYLIIISLIPMFLMSGIHFNHLPLVGHFFDAMPSFMTNGLGLTFYFGGTSLLIVVGVAMDTVNQIEAQLIMRHYEGFSPKSGRIKGRRSW